MTIPIFLTTAAADEAKARRPGLAAIVCVHRPAYSRSTGGRDESRPYIPDGGHLLPLLPAAGEKCGLAVSCKNVDGSDSRVCVPSDHCE